MADELNNLVTADAQRKPRELSGRSVVVAMFVFGIIATAGLWTYWYLHTAPFRPLQLAIAEAYAGSNPRVEGGQRKMHKHTPRILRITVRVEFDPTVDDGRAREMGDGLESLARKHQDLSHYDILEIYLFQRVPEQRIREKLISVHLKHPSDTQATK